MEQLAAETTDKAAAFEQARRKFAAYSRSRGSRIAQDSSVDVIGASRLRTPSSLQVDGELAAQLEEANYLLTGVLDASPRGSDADAAVAMGVVDLASLMQSRALRSALGSGKSDSPCDLCARLRQVLRLLLPLRPQDAGTEDREAKGDGNRDAGATSESDVLRLSLSVLAYSLTLDTEVAAVLIDERAFTAIVGALKAETDAIEACRKREKAHQTPPPSETVRSDHAVNASAASGHRGDTVALQGPSADDKLPLKKSCLKRKRTGVETAALHQDGVAATDNDSRPKILASSDAAIRSRLHTLVDGDPALTVASDRLCLSSADVLCATLHNLLQIENPVDNRARAPQDVSVASRLEDRDEETSSTEPTSHSHREQPEAMVPLDQRQHGVHAAFRVTRDRKAWLVRSGALDTLLQALQLRLSPLVNVVQPQSSNIRSVKEECDQADIKVQQFALHRLGAVLQVLEQAAFFASNVQHRLSTSRELFAMLLGVVQVLGDICWGSDVLWTSSRTQECATVAVDVFLAAMRLLINLTHQNAAADAHISSLGGMKVLFDMFCHVWHLREEDGGIGASRSAQAVDAPFTPTRTRQSVMIEEKLVFDANLLLLSAMANCVENSEENRRALSQLTPAALMTIRGEVPASVCSVLTQFFLAKVQSYKTLIDGSSETRGADGDVSESDDADWSPDDVILGGCSALLLGCLMSNSSDNVDAVLAHLPGGSPRLLLRALAVFVALHAQIGALTPEVAASVLRVETALNRVMLETPRRWRVESPLAGEVTTHEITRPSEQEEDNAKTTTLSRSDITSPNRATPIRRSPPSGASPSPARAAQRRRNLCASLSDSDEEGGKQESVVKSAVIDSHDGGHQLDEATSASAEVASGTTMRTWSPPAPKSPPRSRCSNRSSPSSFRTPSPSRRQRTPKSRERQHSRASGGVASASSTSRRLLKEARNLIEDLDAEFARAGCTPASSPTSHSRMQSSFSTCGTSLASASSEQWSRDRGEDGNSERAIAAMTTEAADWRVLELTGTAKDAPTSAKTTEKKRKRKDYRLPTSPFRQVRRPPSSDLRSGVRSIFQQLATTNSDGLPSTPERSTEAAHSTPLRHHQTPSGLRIDQSPTSASPARRKLKGVRIAPPPLSAAIFDFDE